MAGFNCSTEPQLSTVRIPSNGGGGGGGVVTTYI